MVRFVAYRRLTFGMAALVLAQGSSVWALAVNVTAQTLPLGETQSPADAGTYSGSNGRQKALVERANVAQRNNLESVFLPAGLSVGVVVAVQVRAFNNAGQTDSTIASNTQDFASVNANATVLFSENFDSVTAPGLPAGWTTAQTGVIPPAVWATTATGADSAPNAAFTNGSSPASSNSLISPAIALPASTANAILSFRHAWNFEATPNALYDGGALELSTDGGTTFNNITSPSVGATFTTGGYTGTISSGGANPLGGQAGWGGAQTTFVTSTLSLPTPLNGQTIRLRWRAGWDNSVSIANANWRVDSVLLTSGAPATPPCSLDVNGDGAVTADKDGVLLSRYLLGFRGTGLIAAVPLGAARADAQAVETFIGSAAQFDVFGRPAPAATATQDSLVLIRLMLSVPDTALLGGITLPSGALFTSGSAVRANVNTRCGTAY